MLGVWCHVARYGQYPGQAIDRRGQPLPIEDIEESSGLSPDQFRQLVEICLRSGHFKRDPWEQYKGIWIPAMERRADRYTKLLVKQQQPHLIAFER